MNCPPKRERLNDNLNIRTATIKLLDDWASAVGIAQIAIWIGRQVDLLIIASKGTNRRRVVVTGGDHVCRILATVNTECLTEIHSLVVVVDNCSIRSTTGMRGGLAASIVDKEFERSKYFHDEIS